MHKSLLKLVVVAILLPSLGGLLFAQDSAVPHYDLQIKAEPDRGWARVEATVTIDNSTRRSVLYWASYLNFEEERNPHFFPFYDEKGPHGFDPCWIKVTAITVNGEPAQWSWFKQTASALGDFNAERLVYTVTVPEALKDAAFFKVNITYELKLSHMKHADDYYFAGKMISRFSWFPYPLEADELTAQVYSLKPFTYSACWQLPADWIVAAQGEDYRVRDGSCFFESKVPVNSLPLVLLKYHQEYTRVIDDYSSGRSVVVHVYYRAAQRGVAALLADYAVGALRAYKNSLFALDYQNISLVQDNEGTYGMAADGVILLGDSFFGAADRGFPGLIEPLTHYVVAHEIAHFYAGIGTSFDYTRENYLSEGLAEYISLLYHEEVFGVWNNYLQGTADLLFKLVDSLYADLADSLCLRSSKLLAVRTMYRHLWQQPLYADPQTVIQNSSDVSAYDRSFFVFTMLANYMGKENLAAALVEYLQAARGNSSSTVQLIAKLKEHTTVDIDLFFATFVYQAAALDYRLTGVLNQIAGSGYHHSFSLVDLRANPIFVPTTLHVFYRNGGEQVIPLREAGSIELTSDSQVDYAMVDKNLDLLDLDRKNNVFPGQFVYYATDEEWLSRQGADEWSISLKINVTSDYLMFGLGPKFYYPGSYSFFVGPVLGIPFDVTALSSFSLYYGAMASWVMLLPAGQALGISVAYQAPDIIADAGIGYALPLFLQRDNGYAGLYYYPVLGLTLRLGLADFYAGQFNYDLSYLYARSRLSCDLSENVGLLGSAENDLHYYYNSRKVEDRLTFNLGQAIPFFIPKTLWGVELTQTLTWGDLNLMFGSNSVLGWPNTAGELCAYGFKAGGFFGFPLLSNANLLFANWLVFQGINAAFVYEAATAFNSATQFGENFQQAAGVEIMFSFRTVVDLPLTVVIGVSFNLTDIAAAPDVADSYVPVLYLSARTISHLFSTAVSY